jgi:hypothetical protein
MDDIYRNFRRRENNFRTLENNCSSSVMHEQNAGWKKMKKLFKKSCQKTNSLASVPLFLLTKIAYIIHSVMKYKLVGFEDSSPGAAAGKKIILI